MINTLLLLGWGTCLGVSTFLSFSIIDAKVWGKILNIRDKTKEVQSSVFKMKSDEEVLKELLIFATIPAVLFFVLSWPGILQGIILFVLSFYFALFLPYIYYARFVRPKRNRLFIEQMIDGLTLMSNGLRSGLNIPQAMQIVVDEMPAPICQEFGLILSENRIGLSLEDAFENLAKRVPIDDVNMFVTSVNILRETGGNVAETFDTIVETIRSRNKLNSKIEAITAQGKMAAYIIGAMPWLMLGLFAFIDPNMVKVLFNHPIGWLILAGVVILEAVGMVIIMKIIKIKV